MKRIDEEMEQKINHLLKETKEWLDYYQWLANLVVSLTAVKFSNTFQNHK